jgi:hypothetical protein
LLLELCWLTTPLVRYYYHHVKHSPPRRSSCDC